ncbi:MAG: FliG C-terminal domain-containing protein [Fuerstiella sp.]
MTDHRKQSAALLKLLGPDAADAVLERMRPELAAQIREQMETESATALKGREKRALLRDFGWFFDVALKSAPNALKLFDNDSQDNDSRHDNQESGEDGQRAESASADRPKKIRLTGDPMHDLGLLSIFQLSGALEREQPRTVAILLNNIAPELAANVLSYFPEEHRTLVARQLSREQNAPQLLVERIARATLQRGMTLPADPPDRRDHVDRLAEVLREVPKSYRKDMLTAIEEEDADLSAALMKRLYRFEDLKDLDAAIVQQVLGEIDGTTLTTAMFQADEEVLAKILENLSRRARQTIEEELQFQTRVPEARVQQAREAVADVIAKIDQEGE